MTAAVTAIVPLINGFHPGYERKGIYTIYEVFEQLGNNWAVFDGDLIPVTSVRYQTFYQSLRCVGCGLTGLYFAKERSAKWHKKKKIFMATTESWHFNLYAINHLGKEVLMTKDHIHPKSKGGLDELDNLQTMCKPCNGKKKDHLFTQPMLPFEDALTCR